MCANWKEGFDPNLLAQRIEKIKTRNRAGQVAFKALHFEEYAIVLGSMVTLNDEIPEVEGRKIVQGAISAVAKRGRISPTPLLKELSQREQVYLRRPREEFILATSLSIRYSKLLKPITRFGCTIRFHDRLPSKIDQSEVLDTAYKRLRGEPPKGYASVIVGTHARSAYDAVESAFKTLDLVRGIWNLFYNEFSDLRMSYARPKPVNPVLLGPVHTLHRPNGELATDTVWYQPEYQEPVRAKDLRPKWRELQRYTRIVEKGLNKIKYREEVEEAFRRYAQALDTWDLNSAYIKLWGLLEYLTGTLHASYKTTVRRGAFLWKDRYLHRELLNHLKDYRNRAVHSGKEPQGVEALVYQLKRHVETLLEFHIVAGRDFSNFAEAAEFLDLPWELSTLKKKIVTMKRGLKVITS